MENIIPQDWHVAFISFLGVILFALVGLVWKNLSEKVDRKVEEKVYDAALLNIQKKVEKKMDEQLYNETMIHIQKSVDGINGTAQTLKQLAHDISEIQDKFITRKDHEYEMRLHHSECPAIAEIAKLLREGKKG